MSRYFTDLYYGAKSLMLGMAVTFKAFCRPTVTVHYPRQKIDITPNIRGRLFLVKDEDTGTHCCISCGRCARECPTGCIHLKAVKKEEGKGKDLVQYEYDYTRCSLCGSCVDVCPKNAIDFSNAYELVSFDKTDFHFNLLEEVEK
jgi:NADH-quinone oxidoreductase subunit I